MKDSLLIRLKQKVAKILLFLSFFVLFASNGVAAESAEPLSLIANTKGLSGFWLWYATLYNTNKLYCALVTIVIVPVTGLILGTIANLIMSRIGIHLKAKKL